MFSMIDSRIDLAGAAALDLYAGTGALGIEALSAARARVASVESDNRTADLIRRNLADTWRSANVRASP